MYLQSEQRLGSTGLGLCVVPKNATIRKLICTDADLAAIGVEMGKGRDLSSAKCASPSRMQCVAPSC